MEARMRHGYIMEVCSLHSMVPQGGIYESKNATWLGSGIARRKKQGKNLAFAVRQKIHHHHQVQAM